MSSSLIFEPVIEKLRKVGYDASDLASLTALENPDVFNWQSTDQSLSFYDWLLHAHPTLLIQLATVLRRSDKHLNGAEAIELGIFEACSRLRNYCCVDGTISQVVEKLFKYFDAFNLTQQQRDFKQQLYKENPKLFEVLSSCSEVFAQAPFSPCDNDRNVFSKLRTSISAIDRTWRPSVPGFLQDYWMAGRKSKDE